MPRQRLRNAGRAALVALVMACAATPAHALRIVTWNLLQYPQTILSTRQPNFRTVMGAINADVLIAQELDSAAGRDSFLTNVLNVVEPGQWTATAWFNLFGTEGGAVFYKPAKVVISNVSTFATAGPRDVLTCLLKPVGYNAGSAGVQLYSIHLKAGQPSTSTADSTTRRLECTDIRSILNSVPAGTNLLLGGDTNFYAALEGGYIRLTENQLDNDGRLKDTRFMPGNWHSNSGYALDDTQCGCLSCINAAFPGGGMDDRFDIWFTSYSMQDGQGLDYFPDNTVSHGALPFVYGNDGTKFNKDINDGGSNQMVPIAVANALHDASDHLPVVFTLQLPARILATSQINFGSAIVGGSPTQDLSVADGATDPADALDYSLSAPAGFSAPGGSFSAVVGDPPNLHAIGMSTASIGNKSGTLTVANDDPDSTSKPVFLTGKVLDHAASSLDSAAIQVSGSIYFGDHGPNAFTDQALRVHNFGYDPLQARLSLNSANISGGDGRFSIVGGFSPSLLAGTGQTFNIHFNATGATLDQVYTATLTIASTDEPVPGATATADLVVSLRAKPLSGTTGVPGQDLPTALAFYPPRPNPLTHEAVFAYDLPHAAPVSLAIFDLSGRRIASLVSGTQEADRYQVRWNAVTESGDAVRAGLYFARFSTPGLNRVSRLIVLP